MPAQTTPGDNSARTKLAYGLPLATEKDIPTGPHQSCTGLERNVDIGFGEDTLIMTEKLSSLIV